MLENLLKRFASRRASTGVFTLPGLVLEIQPGFVAGTRLEGSARSPRPCGRMAVSELEPGSLQAFLNRPNVSRQDALHRAVQSVTQVVGNGNRRLGLLIPDGAVRVGMLSFEALPDDAQEAEALLRWRMKEMLPFPPEEARVSYQVLRRGESSIGLLAVAAKASVLAEYEAALEPLGGSPVLILPATVSLLPLLPEDGGAGHLLVHVCSGWMTAVVVAGGEVRLWRARPVSQIDQEETPDLASEIASEVARVLAGSGDHLKVEVAQVWLCARPPASPELAIDLAAQISREVKLLAPPEGLASNLPPPERALFERFGASIAGLIANG